MQLVFFLVFFGWVFGIRRLDMGGVGFFGKNFGESRKVFEIKGSCIIFSLVQDSLGRVGDES